MITSRIRNSSMGSSSVNSYGCLAVLILLFTHSDVKSQMDFEEPDLLGPIVTCKDKCDQAENMPCSCKVHCVVYGNCCENMAWDCPHVWADGHERFAHLLQSEVTCQDPGYFTVSSCPHSKSMPQPMSTEDVAEGLETATFSSSSSSFSSSTQLTQTVKTIVDHKQHTAQVIWESTTQTSLTISPDFERVRVVQSAARDSGVSDQVLAEEKAEDGNSGTHKSFIDLQKAASVTDTSTGITYLNSEIFFCNAGNKSQYVVWDLVIMDIPEEMTSLAQTLKKPANFRYYIPPASLNTSLSGALCVPRSIDTCNATVLQHFPNLASLCKSFISYVMAAEQIPVNGIYNNRYCFQCNHEYLHQHPYIPGGRWTRSPMPLLRISVSLSMENMMKSISASILIDQYDSAGWEEASCSMGASMKQGVMELQEEEGQKLMDQELQQIKPHISQQQQQSQTECIVESCQPNVDRRPDGQCKNLFNATVAFPDEEYSLASAESGLLFQFVKCSIQNFMGFEIVENSQKVTLQFDAKAQKLFHVVDFLTYLSFEEINLFNIVWEDQQGVNFIKLLTAAKVLKRHLGGEHKTRHSSSPQSPDALLRLQKLAQSIPNIVSVNLEDEVPAAIDYIQKGRGKIVDNTTTTVCFRRRDSTKDGWVPYERLSCYADQFYENDSEMMEEFSRQPCVASFSGSQSLVKHWWKKMVMTIVALMVINFRYMQIY